MKSKWKLILLPVVILITGVCYLCFREQEKPKVQYSTGYVDAGEGQNTLDQDTGTVRNSLNQETPDIRNTGQQKEENVQNVLNEETPDTWNAGQQKAEKAHASTVETTITVHVCGAVKAPGVYELQTDSRVWEAVALAGGVLPEADSDYVNQARRILDGERIYIPYEEETADYPREQKIAGEGSTTVTGDKKRVNINTATAKELEALPGIGSQRAESILRYREKNGRFQVIEDIMKVSGIKEAAFEKIKEHILTGYE